MGIAMAGSGAGGLVLAPVTQALLSRYGTAVTLRILGVWNLVICIPISFVVRNHPAFRPVRPSLELAKRWTFILQVRRAAHIRHHPSAQVCSYSQRSFRPPGI